MKTKKIKILLIGVMVIFAIALLPTTTQATYQSRSGVSAAGNSASQFIASMRKMEAKGEVMGLSETVDENTGEASTPSNNIDVHMVKNTEWGGAAMLSASAYGTVPEGKSSASTTGNNFGVFQMADGDYEYVAATDNMTISNAYSSNIAKYKNKYKNVYVNVTDVNDLSKYIPGDATFETQKWHSANYAYSAYSNSVFLRNFLSGMFSFTGSYVQTVMHNSYGNDNCKSRAAIVCGEGF